MSNVWIGSRVRLTAKGRDFADEFDAQPNPIRVDWSVGVVEWIFTEPTRYLVTFMPFVYAFAPDEIEVIDN
jgi:hypothetical protein